MPGRLLRLGDGSSGELWRLCSGSDGGSCNEGDDDHDDHDLDAVGGRRVLMVLMSCCPICMNLYFDLDDIELVFRGVKEEILTRRRCVPGEKWCWLPILERFA